MPTGYTAAIQEGITFEKFVLQCARAFGALIEMRDDPMDAPIPDEFKPTDYHQNKIAEIEAKMAEVKALSTSECMVRAQEEYDAEVLSYEDSINKALATKEKYSAMLSRVRAWKPPTSDHQGLKDFMIEQITGSIDFDCSIDYYYKHLAGLKPLSGMEWRTKTINDLIRQLGYHKDEHIKEVERAAGRNQWVKDLRESLK
jgi:hypothetical protein